MSSKEGHLRYTQRKKLNNLVGKEIFVIECGQDSPSERGLLTRDNGFYLNGKQIPVRSITPISKMELSTKTIEVCSDYLTLGKNIVSYNVDELGRVGVEI